MHRPDSKRSDLPYSDHSSGGSKPKRKPNADSAKKRGKRSSAPRVGEARVAEPYGDASGKDALKGAPRRGGSVHEGAKKDRDRKPAAKAANPKGSPAVTRALVTFIIIALFALGLSVMYTAPILPVKNIQVEGADHVSKAEIAQIADIAEGTNIMRVSSGDVVRRLEDSPWIKSATVKRQLPDTVDIKVTEEKMAAVVEIVSRETKRDERWLLDDKGDWLMQVPEQDSEEAAGIPESVYADMEKVYTISEVPVGPDPVPGTKCTDATILNALDIVSGLSTQLKDQVVKVSASDKHSTALTLEDGIEISFGDATDIRTKERICLQLMEDYPGQIAYINVRVVDRPAWRSY